MPTTKEAGLEAYQVSPWNAIFAPKGTPPEIVKKLNDALLKALDDENTKKACLLHDIGYIRGILKGDGKDRFVIDTEGRTVSLERGASDAALALYHVDRSKIFVIERLGQSPTLDAERITRAVELTRFPACRPADDVPENREGRLVQAADLIGQRGDPLYLKKANALFYEFQEIGLNRQLGYASPADLVERYPDFYWNSVSPHLEEAVGYLNVTAAGREWIANLHSHEFCAEHSFGLIEPQR